MQRAQRVLDNPAIDVAVRAANILKLPVIVYFAPVPYYPHANLRHFAFLTQGIADIASGLVKKNVGFVLRRWPDHSLEKFLEEVKPALLVGDENPLRETEEWRVKVAKWVKSPFWTVDADVIVPSKLIPVKQYAAYIIRPKLLRELEQFLVPCANEKAQVAWNPPKGLQSLDAKSITVEKLTEGWKIDRSVSPVAGWRGGTSTALELLGQFVVKKQKSYAIDRNHPEIDGTSRLSPYLHFGHISPITIALAAQKTAQKTDGKDGFLDQLLTWRELAVNFVRTCPEYDNFECAEPWAQKTLAKHASDPRVWNYSLEQFECAETHDELWNAAQRQMAEQGWMHNYMRMLWAKKILEWIKSPSEAYKIAVHLNDKYELDGRDPNGYAGIAWAMAGKFDRPWFERPIFGQIRYMSTTAAAKKFNAKGYMEQVRAKAGNHGELF